MRARSRLLLAALALTMAACSSKQAPTPPIVRLGPQVLAVAPPPRAPRALYDTEIWARFDRALVARSVDSTTVFLKIDTRRIAADIAYEGITHRILVLPRAPLELLRTYTVELSPRIQAQDGTALGQGYLWQFTTNGLRRVRYDYPAIESLEGPLSACGWSGNGPPVSGIFYDLYASPDSVAVIDRSILPLAHTPFLSFAPRRRWPLGARVYWAVDGVNVSTGEVLPGPLAHFVVLPEGTPVDSVLIDVQDYGGISNGRNAPQLCNSASLNVGPAYNSGVRWRIPAANAALRVADVSAELWTAGASSTLIEAVQPALWSAQNAWSACAFVFPGPPYPNTGGLLAYGHADQTPSHVTFHSDTLAAFVEQLARRNVGFGFLVKGASNFPFVAPSVPPGPRLTLRYYVLPATPGARPRSARYR